MIRKYASYIVALLLIALVAAACVVRSGRPAPRRVYVEKHKPMKHKPEHGKHKH
jgi:hypothetical protein